MRNWLELYIRKTRNPDFHIDGKINTIYLLFFFWSATWNLLRFVLKRGKVQIGFLGKGGNIWGLRYSIIGRNFRLGSYCTLDAKAARALDLGDNVSIGSYSCLITNSGLTHSEGHITICDNVGIGEYAYLNGAGGLYIGSDTIVGQYLSVHPENHNYDQSDILIRKQGVNRKGIRIGNNCWIGSKCTILDGVNLGNRTIVAAGAVVSKSFEGNCIIGGIPAKIIKHL